MVPDIRASVLAAEGAISDMEEDFSGDEKQDTEVSVSYQFEGIWSENKYLLLPDNWEYSSIFLT